MRYAGQNLVHVRDDVVDGVGPWVWAAGDIHAWAGPKWDWENSHKHKVLEHVPLDRRGVVVQAGGNMGMYPRLLSDIFERVYTFEPDPLNFHCLVANCQRNNIVKINSALGFRHGLVEVTSLPFAAVDIGINYGLRTVIHSDKANVPTFTIDDLELDRCDLIMLDVEGYEMNILKGAAKTLEKHKPIIFSEYHDVYMHPGPYLSAFGYREVDRAINDLVFKPE